MYLRFTTVFVVVLCLMSLPIIGQSATSPDCPGDEGDSWVNNRYRNPTQGGFVSHGASVDETVFIARTAAVCGSALVSGSVRIFGNAVVKGEARAMENARIYGDAVVEGNATVTGQAEISGNAHIFGDAVLRGTVIVRAYSKVNSGIHEQGIIAHERVVTPEDQLREQLAGLVNNERQLVSLLAYRFSTELNYQNVRPTNRQSTFGQASFSSRPGSAYCVYDIKYRWWDEQGGRTLNGLKNEVYDLDFRSQVADVKDYNGENFEIIFQNGKKGRYQWLDETPKATDKFWPHYYSGSYPLQPISEALRQLLDTCRRIRQVNDRGIG